MAEISRVMVRRADYSGGLDGVVSEAFERFGTNVAGKKVLVKPNLLSARSPDEGVTTHPAIVRAVIRALEARGAAGITVGDNPGLSGYGESERVAERTGVKEAAGPYYRNLGRNPATVRLDNPHAPEVVIAGEVLDCDVLISLPKFKTHTLTVISCAIKNSYGFLLGGEKARLHRATVSREAFARVVVDVWNIRRPDLVICDAVTAMQGNGPSSRDVRPYGYVFASDDSVALDAVVSRAMGAAPLTVETTAEAAGRGLGNAADGSIEVDGELEVIRDFKLPSTVAKSPLFGALARAVIRLVVSQPVADRKRCVKCGICARHCPVQAIEMGTLPKIDTARCIRCYCCLEFCPEDAMRLSRRVAFFKRLGH